MMGNDTNNDFKAINISVLTISDTRSIEQDDSGEYLVSALKEQGHFLSDRKICKDSLYEIRAIISQWILDENIHGIITTGGTGITGKDGTPEAILPLLSIRQLMGLEKCLEAFLIKTLKPPHCSREPLRV